MENTTAGHGFIFRWKNRSRLERGFCRSFYFLAATILLILLCDNVPFFADNVYLYVSRYVSWFFGWVWSVVPTSAAEILVYIFVVGIPVMFIYFVVGLIRHWHGGRREFVAESASRLLQWITFLFLAFYVMWGCCYFVSTEKITGESADTQHTTEELSALIRGMAQEADIAASDYSQCSFASLATDTANTFMEHTGLPSAPAKRVLASDWMSWSKITGIYFPFTAEANINDRDMIYALPFNMAHEMMHRYGAAKEDEANFLAFVMLYESGGNNEKYSALFMGLRYSLAALHSADEQAYEAVWNALPQRVRDDVIAYDAHWATYDGMIAEVATSVNDKYLRFQGQTSGVHSYGNMVDLLLSYADEKPLWRP